MLLDSGLFSCMAPHPLSFFVVPSHRLRFPIIMMTGLYTHDTEKRGHTREAVIGFHVSYAYWAATL